jgi:hypothetical protein
MTRILSTYSRPPGFDEAVKEAQRRWPPSCPQTDGMPQNSWGAVKEGLVRAVGIGTFDLDQVDEPMVAFKVLGFGPTWEAAFADADRRAASKGERT